MTEMPDGVTEATPDIETIEQDAPDYPCVPVRIAGPAYVHALPCKYVQYQTDLVGDAPVMIFPANLRRSSVQIICSAQPMVVADSVTGAGMVWPVGVPYRLTHVRPVYVRSATAGVPASVGSVQEIWAD